MIRRIIYLFLFFLLISNFVLAGERGLDVLKSEYGKYKRITPEAEVPALIALAFYPELKNVNISFQYKKISTTMSARPHFGKLLRNEREYIITINTHALQLGGVSFEELNLEQQIGIIGHELAHIVEYERMKGLSLIKCGIYYSLFDKYHINMERRTDEIAIEHGLGGQLFNFCDYVINKSNASDSYRALKKKFYLSPEEILEKSHLFSDNTLLPE